MSNTEFANDRILVIDDNPDIHRDFEAILRKKDELYRIESLEAELFDQVPGSDLPGFEIDSAFQGKEGRDKVQASIRAGRPYALAFVDMQMPPGWDGMETIKHLWQIDPELEIVICTAYSDYSWDQIYEWFGSKAQSLLILKKPFDIVEVKQIALSLSKKWQLKKRSQVKEEVLEKLVSTRTEQLTIAKERYRAIFETMAEGVVLIDRDGQIVQANQAAEQILQVNREEIENRNFIGPEWEILRPDGSPMPPQEMAGPRSMKERRTVKDVLMGVRRPDRSVCWINVSAVPIINERGMLEGVVATFADVTERREMQAKLAQSDRMASVGMLAAGVAHEVNNPLTYLLYNTQRLATDLPQVIAAFNRGRTVVTKELGEGRAVEIFRMNRVGSDPGSLYDLADLSQEAADGVERILNIMRDLKTFSHVEEDRLIAVQINEVIESALNIALNEIKYRARLVKELSEVPPVAASEGRLSQVFLNLLVNAAQAIEEGDVDNNVIRIRTWSQGSEVMVDVSDTGKGIEPDLMHRLFDPFFTTKPAKLGTGLGLSICQSIVTSYGGRITVTSESGKGTSFTVHLPRAPRSLESAPPRKIDSDPAQPPYKRGRILVVDDDPIVGRTVERVLKDENDLIVAESGIEAKEILKGDTSFDMILCDVMMPDVTGMDLYDWLMVERPSLARRMVFITGGTFTPRATEFFKTASNIKLEKPFDAKKLRVLVRDLINLAPDSFPPCNP